MTDNNQDSSDEIHSISQRLKTVTTLDNTSIPQQQSTSGNTSRILNTSSLRSPQEKSQSSLYSNNKEKVEVKIVEELDMKKRESSISRSPMEYEENNEPIRNLPEINVPEKIILIIDITQEKNCTQFKLGTGATYMPLFMIKRVVEIFVGAKSMLKQYGGHEFAVMTLCQDSMKWICDFTSNTKTVLNTLDSLIEEDIDEDESFFDLSQIFETLHAHVVPQKNLGANEPPAFITRAILIYSRSNCIPKFQTGRKYFQILSENPYFILDSLFVHEPPSSLNKCEEVYNELTSLDAKNFSYILEVGRNATKLHDNMAKLLAHPLQRPLQRNASYNILLPVGNMEEIQTNV